MTIRCREICIYAYITIAIFGMNWLWGVLSDTNQLTLLEGEKVIGCRLLL
jgi:hypothetical protein